ncbi:NADPH-dependent F420 reductase [Pedosphaera parvula]|uniref:NADP oxidoreductase coenzyme F420-dependent n=1 Tax=Pedosphaera parvula (strain Ellin514) TaxID=320771 RepID=B9XCS2_PEDPL|nr:NADPH-dependent F420 reductase [Pedosphaera parvula]EEF62268.1 NADP oxidoreductase coenzyme F420-dependent [Pedosphaera parvula Ellin514]
MNIAMIGAGNVGGTLGSRWAKNGHKVTFGVRNLGDAKVQKAVGAGGANAKAASIADAVKGSEVVVLTVPWEGTQAAIQSAGNLNGKILIDCTNPVIMGAEGLQKGLVLGHTTSAGEQVADWAKGAKVVKAFNTTGAGNMANPNYGSQKATMFICGDDASAKATVKQLSDELGFDTIDAGPLTAARLLEPTAMLWMHLAFACGMGMNFAFKVLKR